MIATKDGIEIRTSHDLKNIQQLLPLPYANWIEAVDLDDDGCFTPKLRKVVIEVA